MSGGAFNYDQNRIESIHESIQSILDNQGKKKAKEDLWMRQDYYNDYPEEMFGIVYPERVQEIFKEGINALKKAEIYAQRIDWYLSGDDGEDSFLSRLRSDLEELQAKPANK